MAEIENIGDSTPIPQPTLPQGNSVDLSDDETTLLSSLNNDVQQMLLQLGGLEMDYINNKNNLASQISQKKSRLDTIIHDKVVLAGYKEDYQIGIDFANKKIFLNPVAK